MLTATYIRPECICGAWESAEDYDMPGAWDSSESWCPKHSPIYGCEAYVEIRSEGNTWRITGPPSRLAQLFASAKSLETRNTPEGAGRVLGRLLHRRYPGVTIERTARETAADRLSRDLRDPGLEPTDEDLNALLKASLNA